MPDKETKITDTQTEYGFLSTIAEYFVSYRNHFLLQ